MGITNHEKRVFSTFSLSLHLHKPSEHKTTKPKPHVLHVLSFTRGGEEGGEGRPAVVLAPTPSHIFDQEEFVRAMCKQQSKPTFMAMTTASKHKATLVQLERGFGVPFPHSPNPEMTGKRRNKKNPTKPKKHRSGFQEGIFHLQYFH